MAVFDSTAISGIAGAAATVAAAVLLRVGRSRNHSEDDHGVSLTKELITQQRRDFRERIRDLERETRELRAERDHLHGERDTLQQQIDRLYTKPEGE